MPQKNLISDVSNRRVRPSVAFAGIVALSWLVLWSARGVDFGLRTASVGQTSVSTLSELLGTEAFGAPIRLDTPHPQRRAAVVPSRNLMAYADEVAVRRPTPVRQRPEDQTAGGVRVSAAGSLEKETTVEYQRTAEPDPLAGLSFVGSFGTSSRRVAVVREGGQFRGLTVGEELRAGLRLAAVGYEAVLVDPGGDPQVLLRLEIGD